MQAVATFIVRFHKALLALFVVLAIVCAAGILLVNVNKDMTRYLPEDMASKQGTQLMEGEFGPISSFNVMFLDVPEDQRADLVDQLETVPGVTDCIYEEDDEDYNNGNACLFVVTCDGGTYSQEANDTWAALQAFGDESGYEYYLDSAVIDGNLIDLGPILGAALAILFAILFIMAGSWVEPFLLLAVIGIAVALNMGTNVMLPSVSETTFSIAAVLQLVLSMDYSIMLMDRYRQEKMGTSSKTEAMTHALTGAATAIASSSTTTIVGLLCLVFMSFTIGMDMGVVLAKGVFFSLLCVFTVMPGFILLFDNLLTKTAKRSPNPQMTLFGRFAYALRYPLLATFVVLLGVGLMLRGGSGISFIQASENPDRPVMQQYFALDNQIVVLYDATDEERFASLVDGIESTEGVTSVNAYANTLAKPYDAAGLADEVDMKESFVKLLYYDHFTDGALGTLTINQFATFVRDDVLTDESFADEMGDVNADDIATFVRLSTKGEITKKRNAASMADFLGSKSEGMSTKEAQQLYLAYFMKKGGVSLGSMTLSQYVNFVLNDVASDKDFKDSLSKKQLKQLKQLKPYTNKSAMKKKRSASSMAKLLGMDASQVRQLYVAYAVQKGKADTGSMTVKSFLKFVIDDVAGSAQYGSMISSEQKQQLQYALSVMPEETLSQKGDAKQMAGILSGLGFDMSAATVKDLYTYHWTLYGDTNKVKVSCKEFLAFLVDDIATNEAYASQFKSSDLSQLKQLRKIVDATCANKHFTYKQMASFFGTSKSSMKQLYTYRAYLKGGKTSWKVDALSLVKFVVKQADGGILDGEISKADLKRTKALRDLMAGALADKAYDPAGLTTLMKSLSDDFDGDDLELLYLLYGSKKHYDDGWTMSIEEFLTFVKDDVLADERFADQMDEQDRTDVLDGYDEMLEGKAKLVGSTYSKAVITVPYAEESEEMASFLENLRSTLDETLSEHYLIGQGPMAQEMSLSFGDEFNFITLLTVGAIFLIVLLTFRSLVIPAILVALIQAAFCLLMALNGCMGSDIYYVALIVVQAILMGATIDYAILYTTNYRAARALMGVKDALCMAYRGSIKTILTSGSILVCVTGIMGLAVSGITGQICLVISEGSLIALILVVVILPGVLAALDRLVVKKHGLLKKAATTPAE